MLQITTLFLLFFALSASAQELQIDPALVNQAEDVTPPEPVKKIDVVVMDNKDLSWDSKSDPQKNDNNLIRIKYTKESVSLNDDDKLALNSMLKITEQNKIKSLKVKSFASQEENPQLTRQKALNRVISLKEELTKIGFDFNKNAEIVIYPSVSKGGNDYIDVDKM